MDKKQNQKVEEDRHCSLCKFYECVQCFMFCKKLQHRIKASRKNGCKHFVKYYEQERSKDTGIRNLFQ